MSAARVARPFARSERTLVIVCAACVRVICTGSASLVAGRNLGNIDEVMLRDYTDTFGQVNPSKGIFIHG